MKIKEIEDKSLTKLNNGDSLLQTLISESVKHCNNHNMKRPAIV